VVAVVAIPTLGATARAYELDAVAMRAGEGVHLLGVTPVIGDDSVAFYSSHIAPTRHSVVAEAWRALAPMPELLVAGVISSPPGAATHRKVARWFRGISISSVADVYVGSLLWFSPTALWDALSARSNREGVTDDPAVPTAVIRWIVWRVTRSAGAPTFPILIS
jgi:hypothetical protein